MNMFYSACSKAELSIAPYMPQLYFSLQLWRGRRQLFNEDHSAE